MKKQKNKHKALIKKYLFLKTTIIRSSVSWWSFHQTQIGQRSTNRLFIHTHLLFV